MREDKVQAKSQEIIIVGWLASRVYLVFRLYWRLTQTFAIKDPPNTWQFSDP